MNIEITAELLTETARNLTTSSLTRVIARQVADGGAGTEAHRITTAELARRTNEEGPAAVAPANGAEESTNHQEEGSIMHDTHPNAVDQARRALAARTEPTAPETMQVTTLSSGRAGQVWIDLNLYEEVDEAGLRVPDRWEVTVQYDGEITRMPVESLPAVAVAFTEYVAIVQAVAPPTVADLIEDRPMRRDEDAIRAAAEIREDSWT